MADDFAWNEVLRDAERAFDATCAPHERRRRDASATFDDVLAIVATRLLTRAPEQREDASLRTWVARLVGYALGTVRSERARAGRDAACADPERLDALDGRGVDPAVEVARAELRSAIAACIEKLTEVQRRRLLDAHEARATQRELAQAEGVSFESYRDSLDKARERLRNCLTARGLSLHAWTGATGKERRSAMGGERGTSSCGHSLDAPRRCAWEGLTDENGREQLLACPTCALEYFVELRVAAAWRGTHAASTQWEPGSGAAVLATLRPRRGLWVAAALLVASSLAVGGIVGRNWDTLREIVVGSAPGSAADAAARPRPQYEAAGVPADARSIGREDVVLPGGRRGLLELLQIPRRGAQLVAFGPDGAPLWSSAAAADAAAGLGAVDVSARRLRVLVTRAPADSAAEQTACVLARRDGVDAAFFFALGDGTELGRVFFDGVLVDFPTDEDVVALPAAPGEERHVLLPAMFGADGNGRPGAVVCTVRGEVVQTLALPTIRFRSGMPHRPERVISDWDPDRPTVTIITWQTLRFAFPVVDGRLDTAAPSIAWVDNLPTTLDDETGRGEWQALVDAAGGEEELARALSADVLEDPGRVLAGWRGR